MLLMLTLYQHVTTVSLRVNMKATYHCYCRYGAIERGTVSVSYERG
jgi:hypothetical protein